MTSLPHDGLHDHTPVEDPASTDVEMKQLEQLKRKRDEDSLSNSRNKFLLSENSPAGTSKSTNVKSCSPIQVGCHTVVILIKSVNNTPIFTNPKKATKLLNESPFGKYILEGTPRLLGKGAAYRFEISDLKKLEVDLPDIKMLGPHSVRCWVPKSAMGYSDLQGIHYGKFGPIDTDVTIKEIFEDLTLLDGPSTDLSDLSRVMSYKTMDGTSSPHATEFIKFKCEGPLPQRLAVGHTVYRVYPWIYPVLRCFNCWNFGHSTLTCKSHIRCSNCGGAHDYKGCINSVKCFFCNGPHRLTSKDCPIYQKALLITKTHAGESSGFNSPLMKDLRKLNSSDLRKTPPNNTTLTRDSWKADSEPRTVNTSWNRPPQFHTYAQVLTDELDNEEVDQCSNDDPSTQPRHIPSVATKPGRTSRFFHDASTSPEKAPVQDPYTIHKPLRGPQQKDRHSLSPQEADHEDSWYGWGLSAIPLVAKFIDVFRTSSSFSRAFAAILPELFNLISSFFSHGIQ